MSSRRAAAGPPTITTAEFLAALADARRECNEAAERTLAVLREENSTLRRLLEATTARADQLTTEMVKSLATAGAPAAAAAPTMPQLPTTSRPIGHGDPFAELPLGDPKGTFKSEADATLLFPTTEAGGEGAEREDAAA